MDARTLTTFLFFCGLMLSIGCGPKEADTPELTEVVDTATENEAEVVDRRPPAPPVPTAIAELSPASDSVAFGQATFREDGGVLTVAIEIQGADPGAYALHVHEGDSCDGDGFPAVGAPFDPDDSADGFPAGNLPEIEVGEDGTGQVDAVTDRLSLRSESNSVVGRAVVLHTKSEPGRKVACGVVDGEGLDLGGIGFNPEGLNEPEAEEPEREDADGNPLY